MVQPITAWLSANGLNKRMTVSGCSAIRTARIVGPEPRETLGFACGAELIAFLDADDHYLKDRFALPVAVLLGNPDADGVYEASQDFYDTDEILKKHEQAGTRKVGLNTLRVAVPPEDLFRRMHLNSIGHFWICSMTLRTEVFSRVGPFDEFLRTAQDKVLIRKLAALCRLLPGRLDQPVAMRKVHRRNRVTGVTRSPKESIEFGGKIGRSCWIGEKRG